MLESSYVSGTSTLPLIGETIGNCFDRAASRWPEREALVVRHQGIRWTWAQLQERVNALAAGLLARGLRPGDRIGIWSPNNSEWVLLQFASAKAGLILVTLNPAYRAQEIEQVLSKSGCRAVVIADRYKSSDYIGMIRSLLPELARSEPGQVQSERLPELCAVIHLGDRPEPGMLQFSEVFENAGTDDDVRVVDLPDTLGFDDPINIQFTSGTTGLPKGAVLSHHNILNNGFFAGECMRLTEEDRLCIPVPLYHCFGMVLSVLTATSHGTTMVFPSAGFDPLEVLQTIEAERCTALHGVPSMFIAELEHAEFSQYDLGSLRTGIMAGAPCPISVMRRVVDQMHLAEITIAYGMTETSPVSFQSSVDDSLDRRVTTVGRVHPHVEAQVVDRAGRVVRCGEQGELWTRGYLVMRGYWLDQEHTSEAIDAAGWMHTGDLATIDAEGYCNIVGRIKDVVIRGGENVYPKEVEDFLSRHASVEAVQVFGVPDQKFGEQVCAWIKVRAGRELDDDEVCRYCEGQIAHFKIPQYVRFVDSFPMTVSGKPQKFKMRDEMIRELGLEAESTA
jgi:fatty-acyl-CoA synthase